MQIKVRGNAGVRSENGREYLLEEEQRGESEVRGLGSGTPRDGVGGGAGPLRPPSPIQRHIGDGLPPLIVQIEEKAADLQAAISEGANSFLFTEYKYVSIFMVSMAGRTAAER